MDEAKDNEILTLYPNRKTGLLRILFSRLGLAVLFLLLELCLVIAIYHWFSSYFRLISVLKIAFSTGMIIYLFNCSMDASSKLTWMFLIGLFPLPATILLFWSKADYGHRYTKKLISRSMERSQNIIHQDPEVLNDPAAVESGVTELSHYLNHSGTFPVYHNTQVTFFPLGEKKFEAVMEELKKAESFIFMEYFIIEEGYMWGSILKVLAEKAAQGVDVRVMYDGMCEVSLLPHDYPQRMEKLGIKCAPFTPIRPFISTQYNYRDHRKILVIDGKVAFNGGVNLGDEYINRKVRFGHWKDTAVMLKGDAVQSFTLMFLQMWNSDVEDPDWSQAEISCRADVQDGYVMPYGDSPLDDDKAGENVYIDILYRAKKYVHIMTPYLILDNELETALRFAAMRGIDVSIILPGIPDKPAAYALAKRHYRSLTDAGVKIYEYTPGFVHAKVVVSDDERAVVGTINMDYRSLYHHFECATFLCRTSCIGDIETDYQETLKKCRRVTDDTIRDEKWSYRIMGGLLKCLAPLM